MIDPEFKTTELIEVQSDVREDAVDPPEESRFDDGREGAVGPYEDGEDPSSDAGEGAESISDSGSAGRSGERAQTREENSAIRAARIRARREAEAAERARTDEVIAASGIINPYTGRPFATLKEFSDYGERLRASEQAESRAASDGGDEPTQEDEDRRFLRQLRRREEENAKQEAAKQQRYDFIADDLLNFMEDYPEFDDPDKLSALEHNESFREFCGSRFGSEPLSELYGAYKKLVGRAGAEAAAKSASRSERSTGSGGAGGEALTPSQKKALDRWNADNPDMAMTAKEFLSR